MDIKSFGQELAKIGLPLLGAALPIPGGAALGKLLASRIGAPSDKPEDILQTLSANPDALQKAKEFELEKLKIVTAAEVEHRKADSADIASVNATMQKELDASDKEAWYQKAWRPANGFAVAIGSLASVLFVCYLFYVSIVHPNASVNMASVISVIPQLATSVAMILSVPGAAVGIAAWHRGVQKVEDAKRQAS